MGNFETFKNKQDAISMFSKIKANLAAKKSFNLDKVLDTVFADLKNRFGFESINVFLLDDLRENLLPYRLINPSLSKEIERQVYQMPIPMKEEGGISTYVIQEKKPFTSLKLFRICF